MSVMFQNFLLCHNYFCNNFIIIFLSSIRSIETCYGCSKSEDDLQYSVHNLNKIASEFSMELNEEKTKVMAFREMEPNRSKILII
jgi:hypothetical protein